MIFEDKDKHLRLGSSSEILTIAHDIPGVVENTGEGDEVRERVDDLDGVPMEVEENAGEEEEYEDADNLGTATSDDN